MPQQKMKAILILLDGLGDRTYSEMGDKTPLAAAHTPNLDRISKIGANGTFHALSPGICLPSEMAHFLMFGYQPWQFPGRGLLEAAGENVEFDDRDVLVLAHLCRVSIDNNRDLRLSEGRDEITGDVKELSSFYKRLSPYSFNGLEFRLQQTRRNDAILVISGDASPDISDSDPITKYACIGQIMPLAQSSEAQKAKKTAAALNNYLAWCAEKLARHTHETKTGNHSIYPNFLVTQRAGRRKSLEKFNKKWGFSPAMIASGGVYQGLAMEIGFDFTRVLDSEDPGKDLTERIDMALNDTYHNFIHVHTKVPDQMAHRKDPQMKKKVISELDKAFDKLLDVLEKNNDVLAIITADHSTPSSTVLVHSGETVPVVMAGGSVRKDNVCRFDEISAATGSLGQLYGDGLMHMILNCTNRAILDGLCLGPEKRPYLSDDYPAFKLP
jgi:2,3-bisphosphoglycerate-independent phosphoglycerate mutase